MKKDIFDLFDTSDLPDEVTKEFYITNAEKIYILLKYAKRPLSVKELLVGMYRKFGVDNLSFVCMATILTKIKNVFSDVESVKEENPNNYNNRKITKYFLRGNNTKDPFNSSQLIDDICELLEFTNVPVSINNIVCGLYKYFDYVVTRKMVSSKLADYVEKSDSKIQKIGSEYMLKERPQEHVVCMALFFAEDLFKETNLLLKEELMNFIKNGQNAIVEILYSKHEKMTVEEIVSSLKEHYGMEKTKEYVRKAISGMITKQNMPIVCENNTYCME